MVSRKINEHFSTNHLGELLNNYSFRTEFSDIFDNQYYGDVFNLNTAFLNNGELVLDIKRKLSRKYILCNSTFRDPCIKHVLGIYKAKVKFPNNIYTTAGGLVTIWFCDQTRIMKKLTGVNFLITAPQKIIGVCNKEDDFHG